MNNQRITQGKYVSLTYSICDQDGQLLEQNDLPVGFILGGETELIGGMDSHLKGHRAGDQVQFTVPANKAFGAHDESLTFTDQLDNVPPEFRRLGAEVVMQNESGETKTFYVTRIQDGLLTVDGNHPFAGKTLIVTVKILEVRDPSPEDHDQVSMTMPNTGCALN